MRLPVEGTAEIEVSAHVTSRKELFERSIVGSYMYGSGNLLNWRAVVHIGERMEWQWCKTKKEADAWCIARLPKSFSPNRVSPAPH